MPEKRKIGLIGGDKRQLVMAECLSADFECAVWGFAGLYGTPDEKYLRNTVRCTDWESAVRCSEAVILPLPVTRDTGEPETLTLHAPLAGVHPETGSGVRLFDICGRLRRGSYLLGGLLPPVLKRYAAEQGLRVLDYYDAEELQIRNAIPTAEGALAACMETIPRTVAGMHAAVCGYGRVGRTLAQRLRALGAEVFAVARSEKDRAWAESDGCRPVPLEQYRADPFWCDAVFNTIPHRIFDADLLGRMPAGSIVFELSAGCAGTDRTAAEEQGVTVLPLPSLPGKTAPVTAGESICRVIRRMLAAEGEREEL